ncbi:hypothetical protein KVR01_013056 [Diaporthe batatas]|uniref:uncharacterized protein n=1 Tax=Diaporthe batatas TaxID=748121 RepID=UPI001D03991A|nr:uncharacterized protein KVR01_013056 [Diaporthe batatas]KAG8157066.1 hypothetical protein KVR01_013056 [Diaporthe batatas]
MAPQYPNISSRRSRPRQARPVLRPSRERSDVTRRLGQHALRNAAGRYPQQREPHGGRSSSRNGHGGQQGGRGSGSQHSDGGSGLGQAAMSMLVGQLLEEVVDYVVRHNFFRRQKDSPSEEAAKGTATATSARAAEQQPQPQPQPQPHLQQSPSQSSLEDRQRRRRHRRGEVLMSSLDRLSAELETTYDALMRVSHTPTAQISSGDEPLISNVDELRRAITRSLARIESVRHHHRATRRGSRSVRATRRGSTVSRGGSDAR